MKGNDTRAGHIRTRLDLSVLDGSITIFEGIGTTDLLADDGTLRDTESVIAAWGAENHMPTIVYSQAEGIRAKNAPKGPRARVPSGIDIGTPYTVALDLVFDSIERDGVKTVVILTFVMTRLRLDEHDRRPLEDLARDGTLALVCGVGVSLLLMVVLSGVLDTRLSDLFAATSVPIAHGHNIVNVILVDYRGFDTLGEISVVMAAGIAIMALLRRRAKPATPAAPAAKRRRKAAS